MYLFGRIWKLPLLVNVDDVGFSGKPKRQYSIAKKKKHKQTAPEITNQMDICFRLDLVFRMKVQLFEKRIPENFLSFVGYSF